MAARGNASGASSPSSSPRVFQARLAGLDFTVVHQGVGRLGAQQRTGADHRIGQAVHPSQPGGGLEGVVHPLPGRFGQSGRTFEVPGGVGVVEGCCQVAIFLVPLAGAQVELAEGSGGRPAVGAATRQRDGDSDTSVARCPGGR